MTRALTGVSFRRLSTELLQKQDDFKVSVLEHQQFFSFVRSSCLLGPEHGQVEVIAVRKQLEIGLPLGLLTAPLVHDAQDELGPMALAFQLCRV